MSGREIVKQGNSDLISIAPIAMNDIEKEFIKTYVSLRAEKSLAKAKKKTTKPVFVDEFEREFRRIYSDLYPTEFLLGEAIKFYRKQKGSIEFPELDENPEFRRADLKYWLTPYSDSEKTPQDIMDKLNKSESASFFTFSDIKYIVGDTPVDIAYLSPGIITGTGSGQFFPETMEVNLGKCICGMRNNQINIGNLANVLWYGGHAYFDYFADIEDGIKVPDFVKKMFKDKGMEYVEPSFDKELAETPEFVSLLQELTYKRPILVVSNLVNEGTMLGSYHNFLRGKGIGFFSNEPPEKRMPGFSFVSKNTSNLFLSYVLDGICKF